MPASDIKFAFSPISFIGMNASATETGIVMIGMIDDGKCQRNSKMISETTIISSASLPWTVSMARSIKSERS